MRITIEHRDKEVLYELYEDEAGKPPKIFRIETTEQGGLTSSELQTINLQQATLEIGRVKQHSQSEILDMLREKHEYKGYRFDARDNDNP